jgi:hypothetical protein
MVILRRESFFVARVVDYRLPLRLKINNLALTFVFKKFDANARLLQMTAIHIEVNLQLTLVLTLAVCDS